MASEGIEIEMVALRLCAVSDVKPDEPYHVHVEGHDPFAVYKVEEKIYVSNDFCTHGKASLSYEGDLDGFKIVCTWHDGAFDIRTGEVLSRPCTEALKVYEVTIQDEEIFIDVP